MTRVKNIPPKCSRRRSFPPWWEPEPVCILVRVRFSCSSSPWSPRSRTGTWTRSSWLRPQSRLPLFLKLRLERLRDLVHKSSAAKVARSCRKSSARLRDHERKTYHLCRAVFDTELLLKKQWRQSPRLNTRARRCSFARSSSLEATLRPRKHKAQTWMNLIRQIRNKSKSGLLPILWLNIEPNSNVGEGLEQQESDDGKQGDEWQQMSTGLSLDQSWVRTTVANHDDGHRGQPDVHNQILVIRRLRSNLWAWYALMAFSSIRCF